MCDPDPYNLDRLKEKQTTQEMIQPKKGKVGKNKVRNEIRETISISLTKK